MIEQIGKLVSGVAKDIFSKAPEKVDIYKVGTNFINKNTNKRLIVTGTFGGVVEFVEIDAHINTKEFGEACAKKLLENIKLANEGEKDE